MVTLFIALIVALLIWRGFYEWKCLQELLHKNIDGGSVRDIDQSGPTEYWYRRSLRIDEILESWRTATEFGAVALKSAILLNGASAVALIAFIANQWPKNDAILFVPSLRHFLIGTFAPVIATGVAYLGSFIENRALWRWVDRKPGGEYFDQTQVLIQIFAVGLVVYAYFRFWLGVEVAIEILELRANSEKMN